MYINTIYKINEPLIKENSLYIFLFLVYYVNKVFYITY